MKNYDWVIQLTLKKTICKTVNAVNYEDAEQIVIDEVVANQMEGFLPVDTSDFVVQFETICDLNRDTFLQQLKDDEEKDA